MHQNRFSKPQYPNIYSRIIGVWRSSSAHPKLLLPQHFIEMAIITHLIGSSHENDNSKLSTVFYSWTRILNVN